MSSDGSPNSGNAWTSTASTSTSALRTASQGESSWNPAHRPDSDRRHARTVSSTSGADFFDNYTESNAESGHARTELDDLEETSGSLHTGGSIAVQIADSASTEAAPPTSADAARITDGQAEETVETRQEEIDSVPATAIEQILANDEEDVIFHSDETAQEQARHLEEELPINTDNAAFISSPGEHTPVQHDASFENELGRHEDYEHQGEVTEMEKAVDEAPSAPLLDDPEAPPVVEEVMPQAPISQEQDDSVLEDVSGADLAAQSISQSKAMLGQIDRSFTTNYTDIPTVEESEREEAQRQQTLDSSDWPAASDDKTFGELLDNNEGTALSQRESDPWGNEQDDNAFGEILGDAQHTVEESLGFAGDDAEPFLDGSGDGQAHKTEDELAAMFAAAMGDDDLLEDSNDLDPSSFFGDDDPGFLDDELLTDAAPASGAFPGPPSGQQVSNQTRASSNSYVPASSQHSQPATNPYAPAGLDLLSQSHGRSGGTPSTGLYDVYNHGGAVQQPQEPQRLNAQSAQSFADKAKGGYESPYDLPMEVVKQPRRRPQQPSSSTQATPTAPPRSSSMSSQQSQPPLARQVPVGSVASMTPPSSSGSVPAPPPNTAQASSAAKASPNASSGFFEDLPVAMRTRARPSGGYAPQQQAAPTPPPSQMPATRGPVAPPSQPPQRSQVPPVSQQASYGGLSQPERLPLLPDQPPAPTPAAPVPPPNQRYSPNSLGAPSQSQNRFSPAPPVQAPPAANSRYSPAPAAQQQASRKYGPAPNAAPGHPAIQNARPFAPRTSSPLASFDRPQASDSQPSSPPKGNGGRASPAIMSPERATTTNYSPSNQHAPSLASLSSPPYRPDNQSPPTTRTSKYAAHVPLEQSSFPVASAQVQPPKAFLHHRRQFSRELAFAAPNDERAHDPLERWKGVPIFKWGDAGSVISSFPKQTPFYATGQSMPSIKCTPGSITVQLATTFEPMDEMNAKFPGPLASKSKKKKDVLAWMTSKISSQEAHAQAVQIDFNVELALKQRADEKLVLWRIMKIFVEHDGKLEGDKKLEDEIRAVLLPNLAQMSQVMELQSPLNTPGAATVPDPVDKGVVVQLRQALLEGQRERAVWLAEEKKLWGHAMLIASTMGADTWRQVVQSFVRSQVKTVGSDARSLAALYQVFAGNAEECVDELVPPSARAGFQMVSKTAGAISGNPLEGLDQWQETLGLIAGNRTPTDGHSLLSLGKLLSSYGRAEAAHTCYLFARMLGKHTGADDPDATIVLLGANHQKQDEGFGNDLDTIILTEIYEWSSSFSMQKAEYTPHLQPFKLIHAQQLAAYGLQSKAQAYCDHITTAYQSTTRPSPYYHPTFTQAVTDLSAFLSQTPQSGAQGLLSKGAMNNVKSKTSSWFTKFVSGDDDQASSAAGAPGSDTGGPFGGVSGGSPDISRVGSSSELYNPMMGGGMPTTYGAHPVSTPQQQFQSSSAPSKYAPSASSGAKYAPVSSGSFAVAEQRPGTSSARSYAPSPPGLSLGVPRPEASRAASDYSAAYNLGSRRGSAQFSSGSYEPRPLLAEQSSPYSYSPMTSQQPASEPQASFNGYNGNEEHESAAPQVEDGGYQPSTASYGYEPSSTAYEPPSYQPYQPEPESEEDETQSRPKKKGMMDDDDDDGLMARAAAVKASTPAQSSSSKSEADRIAEENFRKAAEADAARDSKKGGDGKKGWFGGWFAGGKKEEGMPQQQQSGPIKAKLGEQSSFYFDKELGKWVNKKDPKGAESAAAATPPPPKGPPSRTVSASLGPPSGPPSRVASGVGLTAGPMPAVSSAGIPGSGPPSRISTPATTGSDGGAPPPLTNPAVAALNGSASSAGPPSQPPSRPSTSLSNASSIDDLLGGPPGPGQRKAGGTVKGKKKGGRYVDVMAK